jgi:hypothetical protein
MKHQVVHELYPVYHALVLKTQWKEEKKKKTLETVGKNVYSRTCRSYIHLNTKKEKKNVEREKKERKCSLD